MSSSRSIGQRTVVTGQSSTSPRLHILACYIHYISGNATSFSRTLLSRSLAVGVTAALVKNVCDDLTQLPAGENRFAATRMRLSRVAAYVHANSLTKDDVLVVTDTDVVANLVSTLDVAEVVRRYDEARRGSGARIVFQAEPFCWAPWGRSPHQRACSPPVRALYAAFHQQLSGGHQQPDWYCPRFLNAGMYVGRATDLVWMNTSYAAMAGHWRAAGATCFNMDDQCLATHFLLHASQSGSNRCPIS